MRVVENEAEFESQMNRAISEALNFWWWFCFYRKYVASPSSYRNQIMAIVRYYFDLFERECSIQRRHQEGSGRSHQF
jgi:propionyl-CoA carboxylase alpha chain